MSGSDAFRVLDGLFDRDASVGLTPCRQHRTLQPTRMVIAPYHLPVLLAVFRAPRSYTGQNMAELQLPGNPALLDRVIRRVIQLGARLAEPGEFTFRAFVGGKLDLTQAEGVAGTIAATSEGQRQAAQLLRAGTLGRFAESLVDTVGAQLALVEAGIDFVDQEDVVPIEPSVLLINLKPVLDKLADLLAHSRSWSEIEALPRVVLVGAPSTGKSTLFNALLGRPRAMISPLPGTTRDILAEPLELRGPGGEPVEVLLVDMAGLDAPQTALDRQVQAAAHQALDRADLILKISDAGRPDRHIAITAGCPTVHVATKADQTTRVHPNADLMTSAYTGEGMDQLKQAIAERIADRAVSVSGAMLSLTPRHEEALRRAVEHVQIAWTLVEPQRHLQALANVELVAGALRGALDALAGLGGTLTPEEVLGRVFSTFCIGK